MEYIDELMNEELENENNAKFRKDCITTLIEVGLLKPDGTPVDAIKEEAVKEERDNFPKLKPEFHEDEMSL